MSDPKIEIEEGTWDAGYKHIRDKRIRGASSQSISDAFMEGAKSRVPLSDVIDVTDEEDDDDDDDDELQKFRAWVIMTIARMQQEIDDLRLVSTQPQGAVRWMDFDTSEIRESVGEDLGRPSE